MPDTITIPIHWIVRPMQILAAAAIVLALYSVCLPGHSIGLYQAIMRVFHWRVEPMNPAREIRNTRLLGMALFLLAACLLFLTH